MKVEIFVNKTIHYPNWDMSQTTFFFLTKSKPKKKKNHNVILKKKKPKKKKKSKHNTHINNSDHTKQQRQKRKNFARCIGIPMGKVELAKFVRSKKSNGGSFSSHL